MVAQAQKQSTLFQLDFIPCGSIVFEIVLRLMKIRKKGENWHGIFILFRYFETEPPNLSSGVYTISIENRNVSLHSARPEIAKYIHKIP